MSETDGRKYCIAVSNWTAAVEMSGEDSLDELCRIILSSFDFIDEHLYEFCMDNRMYGDYSYQSDSEGDEPFTREKLDKLGLTTKQKFSLHYDFREKGPIEQKIELENIWIR